jgi:CO/xanthine dehydrogenase FAD-binding subunit
MRSFLPAFDLFAPATLPEALSLLASEPGAWRPFAGGTDLMVLLEAGRLPEGKYFGLWKLSELRGVRDEAGTVTVGAMTTYTDVLRSPVLTREFPLLCRAAAETGGVATQNRGTLGGNIANASPAADTPPALLVYDAVLELQSARGIRRVPYDRFHLGYKKKDLAADEIITSIQLPRQPSRTLQYYRKVGTRRVQAISKVCLAMTAARDAAGRVTHVRIALGSVAPTVVRCRHAEAVLEGGTLDAAAIARAQEALCQDIAPIDDLRSTARYRERVAMSVLRDAVRGSE